MPKSKRILIFLTLWTCAVTSAYPTQCGNVSVSANEVGPTP